MRLHKAALKRAQVEPRQAVYVDDVQEFVEAAEGLGLRAIRHRTPAELSAALQL